MDASSQWGSSPPEVMGNGKGPWWLPALGYVTERFPEGVMTLAIQIGLRRVAPLRSDSDRAGQEFGKGEPEGIGLLRPAGFESRPIC